MPVARSLIRKLIPGDDVGASQARIALDGHILITARETERERERERERGKVATIVIARARYSPWHLSRNGYACRTMPVVNKSPANK